MRGHTAILLVCCVGLTACKSAPPEPSMTPVPTVAAKSYEVTQAPSHKEIIRAVMGMQDVPLSSDASCANVGTGSSDTTVGDFLSGFLAEQNDAKGGNWLDVAAAPGTGADGVPVWKGTFTVRHSDGEDLWGWGVAFDMRVSDHGVVKGSVRCTGAG